VLAIDIESGKPNWVRRLSPLDAWTLVCGVPDAITRNPELCTHEPGPYADFGMALAFVPSGDSDSNSRRKDLMTLCQKNGNLYALDAATGGSSGRRPLAPAVRGAD